MKNTLLRIERLRRGWTQVRLAVEAGVGLSTVERAERGESVSLDSIQRLCVCLDKNVEQLGLLRKIEREDRNDTVSEDTESDEDMNRREAAKIVGSILGSALFVSPQDLLTPQPLKQISRVLSASPANTKVLGELEKLTSVCWTLSKGNELGAVEELLGIYLPRMEALAQAPSEFQPQAAGIASQGYRLTGILDLHRDDIPAREKHCKQAVLYGHISGDPNLEVAALKGLADTFYYSNRPQGALKTYQEALQFVGQTTPLLSARVYMGLAVAYGQHDQEQDALRYLALAKEIFPERPERDATFHYADFDLSQLVLWEGITFLDLDQPGNAWKAFEQLEKQPVQIKTSERIRIEVINHQAETAISLGDQELFKSYLLRGLQGAIRLKSERRRKEVWESYRHARIIWHDDRGVKLLRKDLLDIETAA